MRIRLTLIFLLVVLFLSSAFFMYSKDSQNNQNPDQKEDILTIEKEMFLSWENKYIKEYNKDSSFVNTSKSNEFFQTVSEAQGYGMFLTVLNGKNIDGSKQSFDKLFNFYLETKNKNELMPWKQTIVDGKVEDIHKNNAPDGDLYIAYSLILAYNTWGDTVYKETAIKLLDSILQYNYNDDLDILTLGTWVSKDSEKYNVFRSSDVIPLFFKSFYDFTGDKRWLSINESMIGFLNDVSLSYDSGLVSDFIVVKNGKGTKPDGFVIEKNTDSAYSWNACRVPIQLAYDVKDEKSFQLLTRMFSFFEKQEVIYAGYTLEGFPVEDYSYIAFSGTLHKIQEKIGSTKTIDTGYNKYLDKYYQENLSYYGDTLFLMSHIY